MKKLSIIVFLLSFQVFAYDSDKVDISITQNDKGKLDGEHTITIHYGQCESIKSFKWKEIELYKEKGNIEIDEWVIKSIEDMDVGGKCD
jgi:hypothetical protein